MANHPNVYFEVIFDTICIGATESGLRGQSEIYIKLDTVWVIRGYKSKASDVFQPLSSELFWDISGKEIMQQILI